MPVFEYKALTSGGKTVAGAERGRLAEDAPGRCCGATTSSSPRCSGEKQAQAAGAARGLRPPLGAAGASARDDLAITTRQLAVLVGAGLPLVEALTALVDQVDHERLKRVSPT